MHRHKAKCEGLFSPRAPGPHEPSSGGGDLLVIVVSRTELKQYLYLKDLYAEEGMEVVLDRRLADQRRRSMRPIVERRLMERRQYRDITSELHSTGWAVVRRPATYDPRRRYDLAPK